MLLKNVKAVNIETITGIVERVGAFPLNDHATTYNFLLQGGVKFSINLDSSGTGLTDRKVILSFTKVGDNVTVIRDKTKLDTSLYNFKNNTLVAELGYKNEEFEPGVDSDTYFYRRANP